MLRVRTSNRRPAARGAAKTRRFFGHCRGRSARTNGDTLTRRSELDTVAISDMRLRLVHPQLSWPEDGLARLPHLHSTSSTLPNNAGSRGSPGPKISFSWMMSQLSLLSPACDDAVEHSGAAP